MIRASTDYCSIGDCRYTLCSGMFSAYSPSQSLRRVLKSLLPCTRHLRIWVIAGSVEQEVNGDTHKSYKLAMRGEMKQKTVILWAVIAMWAAAGALNGCCPCNTGK